MLETAAKTQAIEKGILLGGKWVSAGERLEVHSPYDGSLVGSTFNASAADMDRAIAETVRAAAPMRELPAYRRAQILKGMVAGIEKRKEELARVLSAEASKPIKVARVEVERAAFTFGVAAEEATRQGPSLPR